MGIGCHMAKLGGHVSHGKEMLVSCRTLIKGKNVKVTHETHLSLELIVEENGSVRWRRRTKDKKWKGRVRGEGGEEIIIGEREKNKQKQGEENRKGRRKKKDK